MTQGTSKIAHFVEGIGVSLAKLKPITRRHSRFGQIRLFQHPELGKVFVLNDEIQHVEAWAPLYHEPLVHLPSSFVNEVSEVLILGGGTLYAASEVLKYRSVKRVVLIDHDPQVTETVAHYYSHAKKCLDDPRFTVLHDDAYALLPRLGRNFDLVINDGANLLDCNSRVRRFHSSVSLFSLMASVTTPKGVCADVVQRHIFQRKATQRTVKLLRRRFRTALALIFLPEYHGILHGLSIWGSRSSFVTQEPSLPVNTEQLRWVDNTQLSPCVYYDPRFLRYYFYLPPYLRTALDIRRRFV